MDVIHRLWPTQITFKQLKLTLRLRHQCVSLELALAASELLIQS